MKEHLDQFGIPIPADQRDAELRYALARLGSKVLAIREKLSLRGSGADWNELVEDAMRELDFSMFFKERLVADSVASKASRAKGAG